MEELAKILLSADGVLVEKDTNIDNIVYPCRPFYIEYLYLYPDKFARAVEIVSKEIEKVSPEHIFAIEAAILPFATSVSLKLNLPLSIIRKPSHKGHEEEEPSLFVGDSREIAQKKRVLILDDAIWSGESVSNAITHMLASGFNNIALLFIIDFLEFAAVGEKVSDLALPFVAERISLLSYQELLSVALNINHISKDAYDRSILLMNRKPFVDSSGG